MIQRIKSAGIKELIIIHIAIAILSLNFLYFFLSHFFPFVIYTKYNKLFIVVMLFIIIFTIIFLLFWQAIYKKIKISHVIWLCVVIAGVFSTIVFYLTFPFKPLYPVDTSIIISTNDEISFMHINIDKFNGFVTSLTEFEYLGEWNNEDGIKVHQGRQLGQIIYEKINYISHPMQYKLIFIPQSAPGNVVVELNGEIDEVRIPDRESHGGLFIYSIDVPPQASNSWSWQIWVNIFPIMRWFSLFIVFVLITILILNKNTKFYEQLIFLAFSFILVLIFYSASILQNEFINVIRRQWLWLFIAIIFFLIMPTIILTTLRSFPKYKTWLVVIIFILAASLRFYWIVMVPSSQVSDFGLFHRWALQLASGEPSITITKHATFTRLLSYFYRIYPGDEIFQGLNILFSLLTMFNIWTIGKSVKNEEMGLLAAYFFAVFPPQIGMVSVVCSDILATSLLSLTVLFLLLYIHKKNSYYLLFGAITFGIVVSIRAPLLIYLPIFIIVLYSFRTKPTSSKVGILVGLIAIGLFAGYFSTKGLASTVKVEDMSINEERNIIGPLLMGTNVEYLGRHNPQDENLMNGWESDAIMRNGLITVFERLTKEPIAFIQILRFKYAHLFGDATYGANVAFLGEDMNYNTFITRWSYDTYQVRVGFASFSQYAWIIILGLSLGIIFLPLKNQDKKVLVISLLIISSALLAYTFFEVQPRYFRPVIPYILLLSALGLQRGLGSITKYNLN